MEIRHGNIDLTPIQEQINTTNENLTNINNSINTQGENIIKAIESGDKKNRNFIQKLYDDLFTIESGEVKEIIENIQEKTHIENIGMLSGEEQILNILKGEPSDFKIEWENIQYENKTIIPKGEVNFSKLTREIPALKSVQDWLRIIMSYTILTILITEIWFTILKVLGVSTSIYNQQQDEIERLNEMYQEKVYETEVVTNKGKTKSYLTTRRRIK